MKAYISGPMSGIPHLNFPAFDQAAKELRAFGHTVINPAEIDRLCFPTAKFDISPPDFDYIKAIRIDLALMEICDAIYLLRGYENSRGAQVELAYARVLKLQEMYEDQDLH
jgi:hypothetical protein